MISLFLFLSFIVEFNKNFYKKVYEVFSNSRLIEDEERRWTDENVDATALKHFPNINRNEALGRPILYSKWLSKDYMPVDREELREHTKARLKVRYF